MGKFKGGVGAPSVAQGILDPPKAQTSKKITKHQRQGQNAMGKGTILNARRASAVADFKIVEKFTQLPGH